MYEKSDQLGQLHSTPKSDLTNPHIEQYEQFKEFVKHVKNDIFYVDAAVNAVEVDAYLDVDVLSSQETLVVVYNINGKERKINIRMKMKDEISPDYSNEQKAWEYVRSEIARELTEVLVSGIYSKVNEFFSVKENN